MRQAVWFAATLLALIATSALGQGVEGPLGDPIAATAGASAPTSARATRKALNPRKYGDKASRKSAAPTRDGGRDAAALPEATPTTAVPVPHARRAAAPAADDPISLGFKWQGNNDTAEKTRVQNYNGDAAGTGAAVGLKLHF